MVIAGFALGGPASAACSGSAADLKAAEAAAFTDADRDGDGKLTAEEFATFHDRLRQKLEALRFARLDANGDGALTQDELDAGRPAGPPPFGPPF